ncbi:protein SET DOMAIN GROUP 40 [Ipomoea triloba]|uniref:protein SET DOMAIN GROUP 40 n=1 Tax=Ipomoea triloba TaxID=35885 RepID=UPI00125E397C|nr:protein SET DOMAIN GROUP 40 [Ipomoea triloba]
MEEEEEQVNLRSFLRWAAEQGITDCPSSSTQSGSCMGHSLLVSHFPEAGGRGLMAARDLRKGDLILRVPAAALMTTESLAEEDESLSRALRNHTSLSSSQKLGVALLNEVNKGKSSWWYTYLKQLPSSYDTLADFGHFEIQALQVDDAIWAAEKAVQKAKMELKEASVLMDEIKLRPQLMTLKAWLWASATIFSRTMHIDWDSTGCLCPVGDFFNYAAPGGENSEDQLSSGNGSRLIDAGFEEDLTAYCFYARRNYRKGEQVLLSYGTYTNLELLEHYGFLLPKNPNDKVFIPMEPDMYQLSSWSNDLIYIHENGKPSFALLSTLRLWATPQNKRRSIRQFVYSGKQLSADNEVNVMEWVSRKCRALLDNLPTSLEQDKQLLSILDEIPDCHRSMEIKEVPPELCAFCKSKNMCGQETSVVVARKKSFARWKLAIEWRLNFKRILCDCIAYCTKTADEILADNNT